MKKIKFRGVSTDTDKFVFGDLVHVNDKFFIGNDEVIPESIAQFIGYDSAGNEIYERDLIIDSSGFEHSANLGCLLDGEFYQAGETISDYKLKE